MNESIMLKKMQSDLASIVGTIGHAIVGTIVGPCMRSWELCMRSWLDLHAIVGTNPSHDRPPVDPYGTTLPMMLLLGR